MTVLAPDSETSVQRPSRQFTIRSLFLLLTLAASCAAWYAAFRQQLADFGFYPGAIGMASIALALTAPFVERRRHISAAWTLLAIAIQLTCLNIAYVLVVILQTTDTSDGVWPREWMQKTINGGVVSSLTLPMFALIPAFVYLLAYRQPPPGRYGVCLLASVAASVLVAAGAAIVTSIALGTLVYR